ncbi:MAG TPA: ADOP family duplicated permease [Vicinamibacterales bacterium]|nr:ADOP family duplicated permease [Vicinamibacterales bacterium]
MDEDDFREEIEAHLRIAADERIADGVDREAARLAALKEFGNVALTTEAVRRVWTPRWVEFLRDLAGDVRYAVRSLAKNPAFAATVVGVLTLGIALNAGVFTMLKAIAVSPIAGVDRSARLASVFRETSGGRAVALTYDDYKEVRDRDRAFSGLMATSVATVGLGRERASRSLFAELVSGNYFEVLGVRAEQGRTLLPSDEIAAGAHPVVVISDGLWRRDFAADPRIVGTTIDVNHYPMTIVGVADPAFHGTTVVYDVELFIPVLMAPQLGFVSVPLDAHGFLRPEITIANASAQADALWAALAPKRPIADTTEHLRVVSFWRTPDGAPMILLPTLTVLSAMGLLVLMVACANIAGLVLVRGVSRRGEIGLRLALGATRARIVRLLVVENLVLALPAAVLGVWLAARGVPLLAGYAESLAAPRRVFFNVDVDRIVMAFSVIVACGSALVFGFVPALQSSRVDLVSVVNEISPRGAGRGRLRSTLVVAQVAVSLLLLVGAGLVTRSLDAARHTYPGFDASHVGAVTIDVKQNGYDPAHGQVMYRHVLDALRGESGVDAASFAAFDPVAFLATPARQVQVDGYVPRRDEDLACLWNSVGSDYFRTLSIPVAAGRPFDDRDAANAAPVAMVNTTFARRFWGETPRAIGKRIRVAGGEWRTVVGVAADIKYIRINESPRPYVYLPFEQAYRSEMVLYAHGSAPADVVVEKMRARVAALDPELPIATARPLADHMKGALMLFDLMATMLFLFGGAGMALSALGTYGLVSYTVSQSTHEIGIRMALGASGASIVGAFLARGLRLGAVGAAIGVASALAAARLLGSALFGVSATDPASYARALAIIIGCVATATIVPAWRAGRTNPLAALRHQ